MYSVKHYAYTGCNNPPETFESETDARGYAARILRRRRSQGFPVTTLWSGRQWEILEPERCAIIPDACGVLEISHDTFECRECGSQHETRENAYLCCEDY